MKQKRNKPLRFKLLLHAFGLLGAWLLTTEIVPRPTAIGQDEAISPRLLRQVNELLESYRKGELAQVVNVSKEILNRSGKESLNRINAELKKRKHPSVNQIAAEARVEASKSNISLPAPNWNEFKGLIPLLVDQVESVQKEIAAHPINSIEVAAPNEFAKYEDWIWDLHVFRNQLEILEKVTRQTNVIKKRFDRQIKKNQSEIEPDTFAKLTIDLGKLADDLNGNIGSIEEREAEIRILRIDDANDLVLTGKQFAEQFDAAFALAYDQQFFDQFFERAKREGRKFKNPDLNDESVLTIVNDLVETARTKNPGLFEKATLFYVASHWWLRGRYGQGPLANGMLKNEQALKSEAAQFPLFMPTQMPNIDKLVGTKNPRQLIRRHDYVWSLGNKGIETLGYTSGLRTVVAETDRFY